MKYDKNHYLVIAFLILFIFFHFLWIKIHYWKIPPALIQQPVLIQGVLKSIPEKTFHGVRFLFQTEKINQQKQSAQLLIAWYQHPPAIKVGQAWQLSVQLKPPIGLHNPGEFDYAAFLKNRQISATGYVINQSEQNKLISGNHIYFLDSFREKIHALIVQSIRDPTLAAFISALCVGLRDGLTQHDWQVFQKTGTNHLVAIAGLHIGFVVSAIYFLSYFFIRCFPKILLTIPASRFSESASLLAAIGYTALSGFAVPAQRASIMLFCFMITRLCYLRVTIGKRLLLAALIILCINPFELVEMSFWLSFSSIAILAWVMSGRLQSTHHFISWIKMQGALTIGLLPLLFLFFQQVSLISFFANAIAIPWIGFIILPLVLLSCVAFIFHAFFISVLLLWCCGKLLLPLWKLLCYLASLSFSTWHYAISSDFILFLIVMGVVFLLSPKKFPAKQLGLFGLLPIFFMHYPHPASGEYWVKVIDVGQGLSVLVQTAHHVMLYDTGSHIPGGFDMGESIVTPFLRQQGISTINRLEISHGDNDHSGGAEAIINNFAVNAIFTSAPKLISQFHAAYCLRGQQWDWDGVHFDTLNPVQNEHYEDNNSSCVIKISNVAGSVLLTGDIQQSVETRLVQNDPDHLRATVLIVPHHGSRTSSTAAFLNAVSPRYAIISAGKYNHYHLPVNSVLMRYAAHHVMLYNTANQGAISIRFLKSGDVRLSSEMGD